MKLARVGAQGAPLALLAALLFWCSKPGPDYNRFQDWTEALLRGSADAIASQTLSPAGMPMSHWAHGTGFVLGVFRILLPSVFTPALGASSAAAVLFVISSLALWYTLREIGLERPSRLFVFALFLAGANFGYYFVHLSSEVVSASAVLLSFWIVFSSKSNTVASAVGLGAAASLLITSRPQAILAILPLAGVFAWRERRRGDVAQAALLLGIASFGLLIGVLQTMQVNEWMSGSWLHLSANFGDATFHSVGAPRFLGRVLLSQRTGILVRTPLVAIAFVLSLRLAFLKSLVSEWRIFFGLACLVNVANLLLTSGFYAWSGGSSLGSRYFVANGLSLFLSIPVALARPAELRIPALFPQLLAVFAIPAVLSFSSVTEATVVAVAALAIWAVVQKLFARGGSISWSGLTVISVVLIAEFVHCAIRGPSFSDILALVSPRRRLWIVTPTVLVGMLVALRAFMTEEDGAKRPGSGRWQRVLAVYCGALTVLQAVKFVAFRSATESYRATQLVSPDVRYKYRAVFNIENFSEDIDGAVLGYEFNERELTQARAFRDAARTKAELPGR